MGVLEDFEEEAGSPALEINLKSIKQIRILLALALKAGGNDNYKKVASDGMNDDLTGVIHQVMDYYLKVVMPEQEETGK
jgi:hypothetical protein